MRLVYLRVIIGVLFIVWAILHIIYGLSIIHFLALIGLFFIVDAILSVVAAVLVLLNIMVMFIPVLVYSWINYILLTGSRIFPAPVLGYRIPVIDPLVIIVAIIDIALIFLVTALWILTRRH
ncbi:hypothetical protein [Caldivirga sp.]|mgnify:CR=1 FL=1|uniref:hypothetical protein n=1 Tax=Caldivirga sp. TaxID=2080243 RepID=UPI0025B972C2|nr:hypothetical protein [Caldivirga sp.]